MISFARGQPSDGRDDDRHRGQERSSTELCTLKRYGSLDSLSGWAPCECARTEYALQKLSSGGDGRRSPPVYIDRVEIDEAFRRNDQSRRRQPVQKRALTTFRKNTTARESRVLNARLEREIKASRVRVNRNDTVFFVF